MALKEVTKIIDVPHKGLSQAFIKNWTDYAGREIWKFAERVAPIKGKLTGRHLYVNSSAITEAIILSGVVPNVSLWKNAKAPIDKRSPTMPHPVKVYGQWRYVKTKARIVSTVGVPVRPMEYSKGREIGNIGFFGIKRDGAVLIYGLTQDGRSALPAMAQSVVEWLVETQEEEVQRIFDETFEKCFKKLNHK